MAGLVSSIVFAGVAQGAWQAPQTIPGATETVTPAVGIDGAGNAVSVFVGVETGIGQLMTSDRPAGGAWSNAAPFAGETTAQAPDSTDKSVLLEVNASGAAIALYRVGAQFRTVYRAAFGLPWTIQTTPITPGGGFSPRIAIDAAGNAVVGWTDNDSGPDPDVSRVLASYRPAGGSWSSPEVVQSGPVTTVGYVFFDVAFASTGVAALLYADAPSATAAVKQRVAGVWGSASPLPAPGPTWDVAHLSSNDRGTIAPLPGGELLALWKEYDISAPTTRAAIRSATKPSAGAFGGAQTLQERDHDGFATLQELLLDVSPSGAALAAWKDEIDDGGVRAARRPSGGPWGAHQLLTGAGVEGDDHEVGVDDDGTHVVAWRQGTSNYSRAATSSTAAFSAAELMHPPRDGGTYEPGAFTLAAGDRVIAGWTFERDNTDHPAQTALFGAASPPPPPPDDPDDPGSGGNPNPVPPPPPPPTPPAPGGAPAPAPVGPLVTTGPKVNRATASCRRVRGRRRRPCRIRIRITTDRAVAMTVTVTKLVRRRRTALGSITRRLRKGTSQVTMPPRIRRRALGRGTYELKLTITGAPTQTLRVRVR